MRKKEKKKTCVLFACLELMLFEYIRLHAYTQEGDMQKTERRSWLRKKNVILYIIRKAYPGLLSMYHTINDLTINWRQRQETGSIPNAHASRQTRKNPLVSLLKLERSRGTYRIRRAVNGHP